MSEKIIEKSSLNSYIEDMVKYIIIVDRRRAFPEVKDGLKVVQRRTIFDMFEQGFTSYNKRKKSAKIVGDTMGIYHPHGDCFRADTKLYQLNGCITTIGEVYENGTEYIEILAYDPNINKLVPAKAHSFRIGQYTNRVYHILLSNGAEICCTNNHPFLDYNRNWVKAEELKPGTVLYTKKMRLDGRPRFGKELVQDIVYNNIFGHVPAGYCKHHKDHNYYNNSPSNFETLLINDHTIYHQNNDIEGVYNDGLVKGREEMFSENGKYRDKTFKKNSTLTSLYNQDFQMRRFKFAINKLIERNLELTIENYESLRGEIYNLPYIERIIKYHPEYNCNSFEDLINYQLPSLGDLYYQRMQEIINPISFFDENEDKNNTIGFEFYHIRNNFENILNYFCDLSVSLCRSSHFYKFFEKYTDEQLEYLITKFQVMYPYVMDIQVETVDNEPMYDFTVDGFENMMIPVISPFQDKINSAYNEMVLSMVCAHNSSIYSCMEPMVNWWESKIPLIAGHGNWGTVMGDGPAAMRYTEAGLTDFCYDCIISDLKEAKYVVDWKDNFDRTAKEPEYLPAKVPILIINGTFGIGVGMASNVPSHNLVEVIEATRALIKDPNSDIVLIPDHCQPLEIFDTDWRKISNTGRGTYKVRGLVEVTEEKGYPVIYIKSLPDKTTTAAVTSKLYNLIEKKQLPMIKDIVDPSKETVNIKITLKKGSDPNYVKEVLYTKAGVQSSVSVNFEAVDGVNPDLFSYKRYLLSFLEYRAITKFRLYCNKLKNCNTRMHRLSTYIKFIESGEIDNIINMVKKQQTTNNEVVREYLVNKLNITDIQADFILTTDIMKLSKGYLNKYKEEYKVLEKDSEIYSKAVLDDTGMVIMNEIDQELAEIAKKYGKPRICKVVQATEANSIPKGTFKIVITEKNYIRKIPDSDKINVVRGDNPKFIMRVDNTENLLLFDNKGKVFKLPVFKIPVTDKSAIGTDIRIISKNLTADIISVQYEPSIKKIAEGPRKHYIVCVTKYNVIKKLDMEDFLNVNLSGLTYSKIKDDDEIVDIAIVPADLDIVVYSKQKALRTHMSDIPLFKRNAAGSKAMNTTDEIEGLSVVYPDTQFIVVVTSNGKMNKFPISGLSVHGRAKSGNNVIKLDNNDSIKAIYGARDTDVIKLTTTEGIINVPVSDIKIKSGIAAGQKVVPIKGIIIRTDLIYSITKIN